MVFPVGNRELEVAVLAEVTLQPVWLHSDLLQDSKQQLLGCHGSIEDADALTVRAAGVSPCLD